MLDLSVEAVLAKVRTGLPLTISEAAVWLGIDRNTLAANLRLVPLGRPHSCRSAPFHAGWWGLASSSSRVTW